MRIYAVGFASVFLLFVLMYAHAYRLRRELGLNPVEALETRLAMQENLRWRWSASLRFCWR